MGERGDGVGMLFLTNTVSLAGAVILSVSDIVSSN